MLFDFCGILRTCESCVAQCLFLRAVSWALNMVPKSPLKGFDVLALNLYRVYKGYIRGTLLGAHTKGNMAIPRQIFKTMTEKIEH